MMMLACNSEVDEDEKRGFDLRHACLSPQMRRSQYPKLANTQCGSELQWRLCNIDVDGNGKRSLAGLIYSLGTGSH